MTRVIARFSLDSISLSHAQVTSQAKNALNIKPTNVKRGWDKGEGGILS